MAVNKITSPVSPKELIDKTNEIIDNLADSAQLSYYGTCSTAAATQAKVVVCEGFELKTGVSIRVKFTNAQSYNGMPSLNVNSTGAINVKSNGTVNAARYCWLAGEVVSFTYDGTNWIMEDAGIASTTYYGYTKLYTGAGSTSTVTALTPASLNNLVQLMVEPYPVYSTSSTYAVGDRVRYGYQAWECIIAITTAEAWTVDHWKEIDPIQTQLDDKQEVLVSGTNIKTVNNTPLLGSGNVAVQPTLVSGTNIKTINGSSLLGSGNIEVQGDVDVDTTLSTTSTNPVQNKVITVALNEKTTMEAVEAKGYITGISSSDVTTALGFTPYSNANPSGFQANVIETIKVNGTAQTPTSKTVSLSIPSEVTESTVSGWGFTKNTGTVTKVNNISPVNGNVTLAIPTSTTDLTNDSGFITGITSAMVTTALGFTPYSNANPSGYQANVIETIKVNGTAQTPTSKTVSLTVPTTASDVGAVPNSRAVNGKTLTADITLSASDVGAVPTSRTVNGKALTSNISLSASDVGALPDSTTIPVITDTYSGTSSDGMSGKAVKSALDAAISSVYKPAGSVAFASLPTPSSSVLGNVYDVTDAFTTTSDFVEGAGKSYPANTNVVVVKVGTSYKFDVLSGFVDLSGYQLAETAVTHTKNTAVGNSTIPVYVNSSGVVTTCKALNTAAYIADSTLVHKAGAETITGNKTFSGTVSLGSSASATTPTVTSNDTTVATTKFVKDQGYQANVIETVKVNGTALTPSTKTVSLTVPTSTTQLTNDSGYITGITSAMVTSALGYTPAGTYSTTNPALTASSSICTWTVTHNLGDNVEVHVYNSTTKKEVMAGVALTSSTVATIELFSTSNLAAGAFKAIVIGK